MAREKFIKLRVNDEEKAQFIKSCKKLGIKMSDVLKKAISETIIKSKIK